MKSRSLLRAFVFGLAFGFFYFFQVSVPIENAAVQKGISPKILQKPGSPYESEKRATVLLPVSLLNGGDERIFDGDACKIAPAQNLGEKKKPRGFP